MFYHLPRTMIGITTLEQFIPMLTQISIMNSQTNMVKKKEKPDNSHCLPTEYFVCAACLNQKLHTNGYIQYPLTFIFITF